MKTQYHILVLNPGSTSTKLSLFENEARVYEENLFHDSAELLALGDINRQLPYRMHILDTFLKKHHIALTTIDAIAARGGPCQPLASGIYMINRQMVNDTRNHIGGLYHASMLGVQMAFILHTRYAIPAYTVDPTVVDEYCDLARITGVKDIYRQPASHVLNTKEVARRHAALMGKKYEECRFIVCHIDGGITISAHDHGRMIDGNNGGGGEGPFTPTRMGSMAITTLQQKMHTVSADTLQALCTEAGGLSSWFKTSNTDQIHAMVEQHDAQAVRIWNAMLYQIAKWIGAMAVALHGHVDAILLTGGLLRFKDIEKTLADYCAWIAPLTSYPGEFEQEALALRTLLVLQHKLRPLHYTSRPVWTGFKNDNC